MDSIGTVANNTMDGSMRVGSVDLSANARLDRVQTVGFSRNGRLLGFDCRDGAYGYTHVFVFEYDLETDETHHVYRLEKLVFRVNQYDDTIIFRAASQAAVSPLRDGPLTNLHIVQNGEYCRELDTDKIGSQDGVGSTYRPTRTLRFGFRNYQRLLSRKI